MEFLRKNRMIFTMAGAALLCVVRMLVLLLGTDRINGYSISDVWTVLQVVLCVFVLLLAALPSLWGNGRVSMGDGKVFRIMAAIAAVVFATQLIVSLVALWKEFSGALLMYRLEIPWLAIGKVLFAILSVGFFFLLCWKGPQLPSAISLTLILGPIGLYILRLIDDFMTITTNPSVDTYAIRLLSCGVALLFLSQLGRVLLDGSGKSSFLAVSSASVVLLALSAVAATVLAMLRVPVYQGLFGITTQLCDLALMGFALSCGYSAQVTPVAGRRHAGTGMALLPSFHRGRYIPKH